MNTAKKSYSLITVTRKKAARYRNTLAARKFRNRKTSRIDKLEAKIRMLEIEKQQWREEAERWKSVAKRNSPVDCRPLEETQVTGEARCRSRPGSRVPEPGADFPF